MQLGWTGFVRVPVQGRGIPVSRDWAREQTVSIGERVVRFGRGARVGRLGRPKLSWYSRQHHAEPLWNAPVCAERDDVSQRLGAED